MEFQALNRWKGKIIFIAIQLRVFTTWSFDLTELCFSSKYSLVFAFARAYLPLLHVQWIVLSSGMNFPSKNRLFGWFLANRGYYSYYAIASVAVSNGSQIWHFYRIITLIRLLQKIENYSCLISFRSNFGSRKLIKWGKFLLVIKKFIIDVEMAKFVGKTDFRPF